MNIALISLKVGLLINGLFISIRKVYFKNDIEPPPPPPILIPNIK